MSRDDLQQSIQHQKHEKMSLTTALTHLCCSTMLAAGSSLTVAKPPNDNHSLGPNVLMSQRSARLLKCFSLPAWPSEGKHDNLASSRNMLGK